MAPIVLGTPQGGVVVLSFSFPLGYHSSVVFVGSAGGVGVDWLLEVVNFDL